MKLKGFFLEQESEDRGPIDSFRALRLFARDKISKWELEAIDPLIYDVKVKKPNGESEVILDFGYDEETLRVLGLSDDDNWFARVVTNSYQTYEFTDWSSMKYNFIEGSGDYFLSKLDDENKEKIDLISIFLMGRPFFGESIGDKEARDFFNKFDEFFESEFEQIISELTEEQNSQMSNSAEEEINRDIDNYLSKFDLSFQSKFDRIKTTVSDLINLYAVTGKYKLTIKELFEYYFEREAFDSGGWYEDTYRFEDSEKMDWSSLNYSIGRQLDSVVEKIEDKHNLTKFKEFYDKITSKYKINTWYDLPKDKDILFNISGFEPDEMKVNVQIKQRGLRNYNILRHKFSEENFLKFLHHPELFPIWKD